jgi:hypothetical protein
MNKENNKNAVVIDNDIARFLSSAKVIIFFCSMFLYIVSNLIADNN